MTSQAKKALASHLHFEVKKIGLRQATDGFAVTILIHPNDLPDALLKAPRGTRYMAVLVEIGDDDEPVRRDDAKRDVRALLLAADAADRKNPKLSVIGKERYEQASEMERARVRSVLLAKNPQFREWANEQRAREWGSEEMDLAVDVTTENDAAEFIRLYIGALTRGMIAIDPGIYDEYIKMETRYYEETGQMAEQR